MKRAALIILIFSVLAPAVWAADGFLAEMEDLPLAPGLAESPGGTLFETAQGRIVEAAAEGEVQPADVLAFYADTLPQLGWTRINPTTFTREGERLTIEPEGKHRPLKVLFSLHPLRQ